MEVGTIWRIYGIDTALLGFPWPILYRLKKAPRPGFQRFAGYATRVRFSQSRSMLQRFITSLYNEFSMTDFGPSHYFLGISVSRDVTLDIESKLDADGPPVSNPTLYRIVLRVHALQYPYFMRPDLSNAVQHDLVYACMILENLTKKLLRGYYFVFVVAPPLVCTEAIVSDVANVVSETACDQVAAWNVRILHVSSRYQFADIFTKGLPYALFDDIRSSLSVCPSPALNVGDYKNKNMVAAELVHLEDEHKAIKAQNLQQDGDTSNAVVEIDVVVNTTLASRSGDVDQKVVLISSIWLKPVYEVSVLRLNEVERSGGYVGCVFNDGVHLFRCFFPCFRIWDI
ncbi:ribonuclease H-like domain-containing protein [Tanacetum coccineum]